MPFYESRAKRNGIPLPIQYICIEQSGTKLRPRMHYHEYTELLFGISGVAKVFIGDESFALPAGAMAIVHNNMAHDVVTYGKPCCYHVLKFLPQILKTEEQTYSEYNYVQMLMENMAEKQFLFCGAELAETELAALFEHIAAEWAEQQFGYELSMRADVMRIYLYILRHWREKNLELMRDSLPPERHELLQKVFAYVQANYSDLTEEQAALACGISPAYLSRIFKKSMKKSFSTYVTDVRLREAERLLLTTDASVTDIAQTVGFSTSAYFIARFKESKHATPHQYRKTIRGTE